MKQLLSPWLAFLLLCAPAFANVETGPAGGGGSSGAAVAIAPNSVYTSDTAGNLFPNFYTGAGGNAAATDYGWGLPASLGADVVLQLRYVMPPTIPAGTLKLRVDCLANASSGNALFTVSDGVVAAGASPSAVTLSGETQTTLTWGASDADKYKEAKIPLTHSSPSG